MKAALAAVAVLATLLLAGALLHHRHHHAIAEAELRDAPPVPRAHYGRRLEPVGNTVLLGAGQTDWPSFTAFRTAVAPAQPTVFLTYTGLRDDLPAFFATLRTTLAHEPAITPQIGLALNRGDETTHFESETAAGRDDRALDQLCQGLNSLHRPVFLRPGYEFNGPWNGYRPTGYIAAFRRISARIHTCAPRTAIVWNWSADAELDAEAGGNPAPARSRWQPFYPGDPVGSTVADDPVDWWALNLFTPASLRSAATEQFLEAAAASHHPVMIAESTPRGYYLQTSATAWPDWFAPCFALVHTHPGIRAVNYINWDWSTYPQWSGWGDARIQTAPVALQQQLRAELSRPLYTASPEAP